MKFWETIDLKVTFGIDLHKTRADGKVHDLTTHVNVKYNGSVGTCSSFSGSREFTTEGPATVSVKYYVPRKFEPSQYVRYSLLWGIWTISYTLKIALVLKNVLKKLLVCRGKKHGSQKREFK